MLAAVDALNQEREAFISGGDFTPIAMGIGINTGRCTVGNIDQAVRVSSLQRPSERPPGVVARQRREPVPVTNCAAAAASAGTLLFSGTQRLFSPSYRVYLAVCSIHSGRCSAPCWAT
jgi:hypothetical protein